jgi:hypothetical protein
VVVAGRKVAGAGLLIPAARGLRRGDGELDHAELALVAGGTVTGDESE